MNQKLILPELLLLVPGTSKRDDIFKPTYSIKLIKPTDDWVQDCNEYGPNESLGEVASMELMPRKFVKEI